MIIAVSARNFDITSGIRSRIHRKILFALSRIDDNIRRIDITLQSVRGQKGGLDKTCKIIISPLNFRPITISETRVDLYQAIDRGMQRASQSLIRKLSKKKSPRGSRLIDDYSLFESELNHLAINEAHRSSG